MVQSHLPPVMVECIFHQHVIHALEKRTKASCMLSGQYTEPGKSNKEGQAGGEQDWGGVEQDRKREATGAG